MSANEATTDRSLRIAIVAPPWFEIPPRAYGGIEAMCYSLSEGLVARGHDVTLIAAGRDKSTASFMQTYEKPPSDRLGQGIPEVIHAAAAGQVLEKLEVDVIHDNSFAGPLLAFGRSTPTVVTAHGPVTGEFRFYYAYMPEAVSLVAISNAQREMAPELKWATTIYNGIPVEEYPFRANKDDFALFLGRMSPEKAPHLAIEACREVGIDLVIAAKFNEPREQEYFDSEVRPLLGPGVDFIGQTGGDEKKDLLARARCLVFPIQWDEPFGIVMVEAMACGTPVVALEGGSAREVVANNVSGFVCETPEELPEAIKRADVLRPEDCRRRAELFDVAQMVRGYEDLFLSL
jgi:glycosyltransferase involved in cell wall biosynthesis